MHPDSFIFFNNSPSISCLVRACPPYLIFSLFFISKSHNSFNILILPLIRESLNQNSFISGYLSNWKRISLYIFSAVLNLYLFQCGDSLQNSHLPRQPLLVAIGKSLFVYLFISKSE